jgi:hypothetical protein
MCVYLIAARRGTRSAIYVVYTQQLVSNDYSRVCVSHAAQLLPEQTARQAIWHDCFKLKSAKYAYPYCNLAEYYTFKRASD